MRSARAGGLDAPTAPGRTGGVAAKRNQYQSQICTRVTAISVRAASSCRLTLHESLRYGNNDTYRTRHNPHGAVSTVQTLAIPSSSSRKRVEWGAHLRPDITHVVTCQVGLLYFSYSLVQEPYYYALRDNNLLISVLTRLAAPRASLRPSPSGALLCSHGCAHRLCLF